MTQSSDPQQRKILGSNLSPLIDYQMTLGKEGNRDILRFKVEVTGESQKISEAISKTVLSNSLIRKNVEADRMALPQVELVSQGALKRLTRAKKLIVDER